MLNLRKKSLFVGSIIALLILISPYLLFINKNMTQGIKSYDTLFGVINSGYFVDFYTFTYWFFSKFVPLFLFLIWFLTCKHWWVHVILIPITVYLFQLITVINDSVQYVDEVEFIYTVPIAAIVMGLLYFIRSKMSIYIQAIDLKKEMDDNMQVPKKFK
ncbi:hypothetical protein [Lutibacter sp.]|uniref:hypothetical protein n=1 Tax=Lutibacter sp. TaxID=1925666 RepID=UPI0035661BB4